MTAAARRFPATSNQWHWGSRVQGSSESSLHSNEIGKFLGEGGTGQNQVAARINGGLSSLDVHV
jgi:hypothetical protein